jgi:flagellar basal-body rod protein FlgB
MNPVPEYDPLSFGETALRLRTYRQQILGSNLANADTQKSFSNGETLRA